MWRSFFVLFNTQGGIYMLVYGYFSKSTEDHIKRINKDIEEYKRNKNRNKLNISSDRCFGGIPVTPGCQAEGYRILTYYQEPCYEINN